jgi:hypothetical protein
MESEPQESTERPSDDVDGMLRFMRAQADDHRHRLPPVGVSKTLAFLGTTNAPSTRLLVSAHEVIRVERSPDQKELRVRLRGRLGRPLAPRESVTVLLVDLPTYRGYQIKTHQALGTGGGARLVEDAHGEILVHGRLVYTVHHGPNELTVFEKIPFEDVEADVGAVRYALVGIGERSNLSPRFVFHWEVRDGRPCMFHGDGYAHKTYVNLQINRQETRVVVDLDSYSGYAFGGMTNELIPGSEPMAVSKTHEGFAASGWGSPERTFEFSADQWRPIAP